MTEEGTNSNGTANGNAYAEIFSKVVRAGKRTYFFDVKNTKGGDYYLTITESKKKFGDDGKFFYEKHKVFLYKEDFDKFADGLTETVAAIRKLKPAETSGVSSVGNEVSSNGFTDVNFEDLKTT